MKKIIILIASVSFVVLISINPAKTSSCSQLRGIQWKNEEYSEHFILTFDKLPEYEVKYSSYPAMLDIELYSTVTNIGFPVFKESRYVIRPISMFSLPSLSSEKMCIVFNQPIKYVVACNNKTNDIIIKVDVDKNTTSSIYSLRTYSFIDYDDKDMVNCKIRLERISNKRMRFVPGELLSIVIEIAQYDNLSDAESDKDMVNKIDSSIKLLIEYRESGKLPKCILTQGQQFDDNGA